eukprot:TRINITY_DN17104_c0_g1_i1.p1 TRINITY_DN17104_c0_g1~~TRINITY_DN17104_c0_g1_i1.p1  ORF type:complete len:316 (-),score=100.42 TRINITY_DN17104_c0_g1_i1:11-832(-)
MENRLSYETIASFRELGDALFLQQKLKSEQKANEENSKKGFFGKMLNSTKAKLEEKVDINTTTLKELYGQINEIEDKKTESKLPPEYVKMKIDFVIKKTVLQVLKNTQNGKVEPILDVNLDSFKLHSKVRENSLSLLGHLERFTANDYHTLDGKPFKAIGPVQKEKKQLEFEFHSNPLNHPYNADTKIVLNAQSLDIFFFYEVDRQNFFFLFEPNTRKFNAHRRHFFFYNRIHAITPKTSRTADEICFEFKEESRCCFEYFSPKNTHPPRTIK